MSAHVDAAHVTRRFGDFTAVDDVGLRVEAGEVVALLGANGAGKTTLIKMVLGLLRPTAGRVQLFGQPPGLEQRRRIGYVPQNLGLYTDLSVDENLAFRAEVFGCAQVGAGDLPGGRHVGDLPLGLQRRAAFAAALQHRPELLVLDEPTSGVSPLSRSELWDLIRSEADRGAGVLVSTHYMDEAERCHRIHYISYGKLLASGTVGEVVADAHLTTWVLEGGDLTAAVRALNGAPGVEQVAPFGTTIHVVGGDADALEKTVRQTAEQTGAEAHKGETSLEDVFIRFMAESKDNMA